MLKLIWRGGWELVDLWGEWGLSQELALMKNNIYGKNNIRRI